MFSSSPWGQQPQPPASQFIQPPVFRFPTQQPEPSYQQPSSAFGWNNSYQQEQQQQTPTWGNSTTWIQSTAPSTPSGFLWNNSQVNNSFWDPMDLD